tara:strand:- start:36122 stop:37654 length:1533 start_codon:yes stop_codon:yes gene_type:complete
MNTSTTKHEPLNRRWLVTLTVCCLAAACAGAGIMYLVDSSSASPGGTVSQGDADHEEEGDHGGESESTVVALPKSKWEAAGIRIKEVSRGSLAQNTWVTGKVTLNEDRVAHIYSLVDGRVHEVPVQFGDDVKKDQPLAVIDSREVGTAKLDLHRSRLNAEVAQVNHDWQQSVSTNTLELIASLSQGAVITEIDAEFRDKPMGDYRGQLLTAFASLHKSRADFERLKPLAEKGVTAGKDVLAAQAAFEADGATFRSLLEQLKFEAPREALLAEQTLRQTQQAVAVAKAQLFILGYHEDDLVKIDPEAEGENISHYELRAPFDGTVLSKNVVLAERVGPDTEMFQIADLSSVWIQADLYQKDLPKLSQLGDTLHFRAPLLTDIDDGHTHEARIFYKGDVLDEQTRTMRLRAVLDNPKRHLKPGMFVEVQLPGDTISDVLVIAASAVQSAENETFVFVHKAGDEFERRKVTLGATSNGTVQIRTGLNPGEKVVVDGGFSLKSELMKGQISHGH